MYINPNEQHCKWLPSRIEIELWFKTLYSKYTNMGLHVNFESGAMKFGSYMFQLGRVHMTQMQSCRWVMITVLTFKASYLIYGFRLPLSVDLHSLPQFSLLLKKFRYFNLYGHYYWIYRCYTFYYNMVWYIFSLYSLWMTRWVWHVQMIKFKEQLYALNNTAIKHELKISGDETR
jgi:hypothetical protein